MRFTVLGDFTVDDNGKDITPRPAKPRSLLALLAVRNGETVSRDMIMRELWSDFPPERALGTIHTYIYEIRRCLADASPAGGDQVLVTKPHGYTLNLDKVEFDFARFEELFRTASAVLAGAETAPSSESHLLEASEYLSAALSLCRGEPLANVLRGEQLASHAMWLDERRRQVMEMRLNLDLRLGRDAALIGELKVLVEQHPFHERFYEILMCALSRTGRRSEALDTYHRLRNRLAEELGLEPSPSIQRVQRALLMGDPEVTESPPSLAYAHQRSGDLRA